MQNILAITAHPDDLELMAGGTILKAIDEGCNVYVLTFSDGSWYNPHGKLERSRQEAAKEEADVAKFVGYTCENLGQPALNLSFSDNNVIEILKRINKYSIDTLICPFKKDLHHDHEVVTRIAIAASRRVPNLLMGQVNYYVNEFFVPNVFVDISNYWDRKIEALKLYAGQWKKSGNEWFEFMDSTTKYYGKIAGVKRAEGFYSNKILL